jgi:hypothetical protein
MFNAVFGWSAGWSALVTLLDTAGFDQGFVASSSRGCEDLSSQIHQLICDLLIVAEDHKTSTPFAREGMLKDKWGIATNMASWNKVG